MLYNINPYSSMFRQVSNIHRLDSSLDLKMIITNNRREDPRHYNIPTISEIAVIMISDKQTNKLFNYDSVYTYVKKDYKEYQSYILVSFSSSSLQSSINNRDHLNINKDKLNILRKHINVMNYVTYRLHLDCLSEAVVLYQFR
ncbi:5946_t:CDS:2 [Cetraspora pellucida]|uniref:5946_t:CDS:1 n=1 Tax=Cetraspora pellucida TaxID=1433469 RepID=A0A9N9IGN6_9GLOM|nr:5946_t:CDS:2 [Cetraspora pellucida]